MARIRVTNTTVVSGGRVDLFGKYEFEAEVPLAAGPVTTSANSTATAGRTEERFEFQAGGTRLLLADGRLTLNGRDAGAVQAGDRIRLAADGRLYVNGRERPGN